MFSPSLQPVEAAGGQLLDLRLQLCGGQRGLAAILILGVDPLLQRHHQRILLVHGLAAGQLVVFVDPVGDARQAAGLDRKSVM